MISLFSMATNWGNSNLHQQKMHNKPLNVHTVIFHTVIKNYLFVKKNMYGSHISYVDWKKPDQGNPHCVTACVQSSRLDKNNLLCLKLEEWSPLRVCLRVSTRQGKKGAFWVSGYVLDLDLDGGHGRIEECVNAPFSALVISMLCLVHIAYQSGR